MVTTFSPPFLREVTGFPFTSSLMSWIIVHHNQDLVSNKSQKPNKKGNIFFLHSAWLNDVAECCMNKSYKQFWTVVIMLDSLLLNSMAWIQ